MMQRRDNYHLMTINMVLESNCLTAKDNDFRLNYDVLKFSQVVIARNSTHALVAGYGVCGVGMMWITNEEAKDKSSYKDALIIKED